MIRHIGKAALLAAAVITAGTAFVNCSRKTVDGDNDIGSITLALTLSPGVIVNTVTYTISGNGITPINGSIDVTTSTTANATAFVSGLPTGNGYLVKMHADSTDNMTHCDGQTNFNVLTGQTAMANVTLQCFGPTIMQGQVAIGGKLDNCPFITGLSANALQAAVGGSITVNVAATDKDPADVISYAWSMTTAGIGTLGTPAAATTTFTCTAPGTTSLSITISDTVCGETRTGAIPLTCVRGGGTAGTTGAGGTAGTGVAGTTGTAGVAGTGVAGTTGTAGTGGVAGTTGGTGGTVMACAEPVSGNATACCSCTTDNCSIGPTGSDGCSGLADPTDKALCVALYSCIATNSATCTASGDPTNCFCGSAPSGGSCFAQAGAANGPCATAFINAAKTTDPVQIQARFVSPNFPIGRAVNLTACRGSFCSAECSIQ